MLTHWPAKLILKPRDLLFACQSVRKRRCMDVSGVRMSLQKNSKRIWHISCNAAAFLHILYRAAGITSRPMHEWSHPSGISSLHVNSRHLYSADFLHIRSSAKKCHICFRDVILLTTCALVGLTRTLLRCLDSSGVPLMTCLLSPAVMISIPSNPEIHHQMRELPQIRLHLPVCERVQTWSVHESSAEITTKANAFSC